jgi:hypothetical protein
MMTLSAPRTSVWSANSVTMSRASACRERTSNAPKASRTRPTGRRPRLRSPSPSVRIRAIAIAANRHAPALAAKTVPASTKAVTTPPRRGPISVPTLSMRAETTFDATSSSEDLANQGRSEDSVGLAMVEASPVTAPRP